MSSPGDWYGSLPPISKLFGTSCVITTVLVTVGMLNPALLMLNYDLVLFKFQVSTAVCASLDVSVVPTSSPSCVGPYAPTHPETLSERAATRAQVWRLLANFVFLGGFGIPFVIKLMMMCAPPPWPLSDRADALLVASLPCGHHNARLLRSDRATRPGLAGISRTRALHLTLELRGLVGGAWRGRGRRGAERGTVCFWNRRTSNTARRISRGCWCSAWAC